MPQAVALSHPLLPVGLSLSPFPLPPGALCLCHFELQPGILISSTYLQLSYPNTDTSL